MTSISSRRDLLSHVYSRANRLMQCLLGLLFCVTLGMAAIHDFWEAVILVGLPATLIPLFMTLWSPTRLMTRLAVAIAFMVHAGLQIHLLLGMIEGHFVIFVLLSALLAYRDWRPLLVGAATIIVHHLLFCYLQHHGWDVYVAPVSHMLAPLPMVLVHAAYVFAQSCVLGLLARQMEHDAVSAQELTRLSTHIGRQEGVFDLSFDESSMHSPIGREFKHTMLAVRATLERVDVTLGEVTAVSDTLGQGNDALASRNQSQETALGRTHQKLETLSRSVQDNSDYAERATRFAAEAGSVAEAGQELAEASTQTMHRLKESSQRIADITGLIDSIAFQTNILALNAAVEAARAGESGRGFAVVASEVQALANRSAIASKDVREQTQISHQGVLEGTVNAERVASNMTDILARTRQLSTVIDDISRASREQSADLKDVTADVESIGQDTHDNGLLVDRVSKASERLHRQSQSLERTISAFELGCGARAALSSSIPASATQPARAGPDDVLLQATREPQST